MGLGIWGRYWRRTRRASIEKRIRRGPKTRFCEPDSHEEKQKERHSFAETKPEVLEK